MRDLICDIVQGRITPSGGPMPKSCGALIFG